MKTRTRSTELDRVDINAIKFGQGTTAGLLALAFVTDLWLLAALIGGVNLIGSVSARLNLMPRLYRIATPLLGLRARIVADETTPHRFAQGFSGTVTLAGASAVAWGAVLAGWSLVLVVVGLAMLNITAGFCAGCFTYHQLRRAGILGRAG